MSLPPTVIEVYRKRHGEATLIIDQVLSGGYATVCPFSFCIIWEGKTGNIYTLTDRCSTKRSALARGLWRCKWLNNGTFFTRYQ